MNWKRCRKFLRQMENPTIVYHKDTDGVCSAVLVHGLVLGTTFPNDRPGIGLSEDLLEILKDSRDIIFLDLPVDQLSVVEKFKAKTIFVLDHHSPKRDLSRENLLHVNPRFENPEAYIPTSYLSYQIVKEELENPAWKAAVGVIGDHGVEDCQDLIDAVEQENPEVLPENKYDYSELKKSRLGIIAEMINASKVINGIEGIKESYEVIRKSEEPKEVFDTRLLDYYNKYKKKLEEEERKFKENREYFPKTDAYLYEIESKNSLGSDLATKMADEKPDSVVIVYRRGSYGMEISGRCQSGRVNVSQVLEKVVGKEGRAGGHPQAAGGFVEPGKEEVVLERLKERLEELS